MGDKYEITEQALGDGRHWRKFYDSRVLRYWHLPDGKDITLLIESVTEATSKVKTQLVLHFKGAKLPLAMNATNCMTIEQLYGADPHGWAGNRITLYMTTTEYNAKTVPCIRIRPRKPSGSTAKRAEYEPEPQLNETATEPGAEPAREPGEEG